MQIARHKPVVRRCSEATFSSASADSEFSSHVGALSTPGRMQRSTARHAAAIFHSFSTSHLQLCNDGRSEFRIFERLSSAQFSRVFWGQQWGQLGLASIDFHSVVRSPPPPPKPPRTSVGLPRISEEKVRQVPICVGSIARFRNRIGVLQRLSSVHKPDEAVGANVPPLGDRPQRSSCVRRQPRNLGATLGAGRRHRNQLPPKRMRSSRRQADGDVRESMYSGALDCGGR